MSTNTYEITNEWRERIKDMPPPERTDKPGRPCSTLNRDVLNGSLRIAHTGSQRKELPSVYGKKSTVHERFKAWKDSDVLESVFAEFSKDRDMQDLSFDSASRKAHRHAAGAERGLPKLLYLLMKRRKSRTSDCRGAEKTPGFTRLSTVSETRFA